MFEQTCKSVQKIRHSFPLGNWHMYIIHILLVFLVSQHVNMPLLRLAHQFVSMIENINETRVELEGQKPASFEYKTHRKQDSKSSTGTGTESQATEFDSAKPEVTSPISIETDTPTPDSHTPFVASKPATEGNCLIVIIHSKDSPQFMCWAFSKLKL